MKRWIILGASILVFGILLSQLLSPTFFDSSREAIIKENKDVIALFVEYEESDENGEAVVITVAEQINNFVNNRKSQIKRQTAFFMIFFPVAFVGVYALIEYLMIALKQERN